MTKDDGGGHTATSFEIDGRVYGSRMSGGHVTELVQNPPVFTKLLDLPPMPRGEALAAAMLLERDSVPFAMESAFVDVWSQPAVKGNGRERTLMAAAPSADMLMRKERLGSIGMRPGAFAPAVSAIGALVRNSRIIPKNTPVAFIMLEPPSLGIYIFWGDAVIFTREITGPSGPGYIQWGAEQTAKSLEYYERSSGTPPAAHGFAIGMSASIGDNSETISRATGIKFDIYDPFNDFVRPHPSIAKMPQDAGPALAALIGAAIDGGETLNLAPKSFPAISVGMAASVAAVALLIVTIAGFMLNKNHAGSASRERDYAATVKELESVTSANMKLEMELKAYPAIAADNGPDWEMAFKAVSLAMPSNAALSRLTINANPAGGALRNTRMEGETRGSEAARFEAIELIVNALKDSPGFVDVTLVKAKMEPAGNGTAYFEIAANIVPKKQIKTARTVRGG
ncbi:MAG: hypothetical protein HZB29_04215 [Nitrospinae bacterium]|nr:hypothetical protein [Nitrospinota bacterium]